MPPSRDQAPSWPEATLVYHHHPYSTTHYRVMCRTADPNSGAAQYPHVFLLHQVELLDSSATTDQAIAVDQSFPVDQAATVDQAVLVDQATLPQNDDAHSTPIVGSPIDPNKGTIAWYETDPMPATAEELRAMTRVFVGNVPIWIPTTIHAAERKVIGLLLSLTGVRVSEVKVVAVRNKGCQQTGSFHVSCSAEDAEKLYTFHRKAYCTPDYVRYHKEWCDSDLEVVREEELVNQQGTGHMPKNLLTVELATGEVRPRGQKKHTNGIKADPAHAASQAEVATTTTPQEEHKRIETSVVMARRATAPCDTYRLNNIPTDPLSKDSQDT